MPGWLPPGDRLFRNTITREQFVIQERTEGNSNKTLYPTTGIKTDMTTLQITDDLDLLLAVLPDRIRTALEESDRQSDLLEIVMDLGRLPEARFTVGEMVLSTNEITPVDLQMIVDRVGDFGKDNRAGIERTLHRISAIRNRKGDVIGLT